MVTHGVPLLSLMDTPPKRAATAMAAYQWSPYIRMAERAIAARASTIPWWLEDADGAHVTDESPDTLRAIRDLLETPYSPKPGDPVTATPRTWAGLSSLTLRHEGVVGYAFWYLSQVEALAGTPLEVLYVSPARMTPATNDAGQLIGYVMDAGGVNPVAFTLQEVIRFDLEPADEGHLPTGLVQTALAKAEIARLGDKHAAYILASGGRMPGIYHPPAGGSIPEEQYQGLVRDLRSVVEMPDAAKRSLVLKGPVEFDQTAQAPAEMQLLDIMAMSRDDILGLWGVPKSQVGYERAATIGGSATDLDAEAMWKNAVGPRLHAFVETLQTQLLDRYADLGIAVEFELDEPTFDDDAPKYTMASQATSIPLRNAERRAIIGLPPTGDPAIDDTILLPVNMVTLYQAPPSDAGDMGSMAKADLEHDRRVVSLRDALATFLREQADRIGARLERNSAHVKRKPSDDSAWWTEHEEDAALLSVMRAHVVDFAEVSGVRARSKVTGKAGMLGAAPASRSFLSGTPPVSTLLHAAPFSKASTDDVFRAALERLTYDRLARRVTGINRTTRDRIRQIVLDGLDAGTSPAQVGRLLRGEVLPLPSDTAGQALYSRVGDFGSELRAETIARTEMRVAQNAAAIDSYQALGVGMVQMIDGDEDAACAARDGRIVDLATAESEMAAEHPNGTLDFAPWIGEEPAGKAQAYPVPVAQQPSMTINVNVPDIHVPTPNVTIEHLAIPEQAVPIVNVAPPVVHVAAPVVNVAAQEAPVVNVAPAEVTVNMPEGKASADVTPVYVVNMPEPHRYAVKRGPDGRIIEVAPE